MRSFLIGLLALTMLAIAPAGAQPTGGLPAGAQPYTQEELDQLLAPIALYPDQLLTQILIAATYPLEVVEAARFVQQNPGLTGEALDQALTGRNWDPSVQSLAAFPQVLAMMNDKLEWTQRLGDAFLVDEQRVMDTVQSLRQRAQAAGNLQSTPQQSVINQDNEIIIEPPQPDVVYVPVYNPLVIYGPWWAPDYPPWFWYPPPIYGYPVGIITVGIVFGAPWAISHHHWGWARPDWHGHRINLNIVNNRFWNRPGRPPPPSRETWQHTPEHRRGVAYPDAPTRDRFVSANPNAVRERQNFRGYVPQPQGNVLRPSPGAVRPAPNVPLAAPGMPRATTTPPPTPGIRQATPGVPQATPSVPQATPSVPRPIPSVPGATPSMPQITTTPRSATSTFDPGLSRQQSQINAQRGMQSREAIRAAPPPPQGGRQNPVAPAPVAPAQRGGGGRSR